MAGLVATEEPLKIRGPVCLRGALLFKDPVSFRRFLRQALTTGRWAGGGGAP